MSKWLSIPPLVGRKILCPKLDRSLVSIILILISLSQTGDTCDLLYLEVESLAASRLVPIRDLRTELCKKQREVSSGKMVSSAAPVK